MAALKSKANSQMKRRSAQYKRHYNTNVHVKPELVPNQLMFDEKPSLTGNANTADGMARKT